jgi:DOPA 4,5-dioxygenase
MAETPITGWHAHIYYDPDATKDAAARLREGIAARFPSALLGRWHDVPVGPHPTAMYQVAFAPDLFPTLVPFMALHREGLTVLVHPETGRQ